MMNKNMAVVITIIIAVLTVFAACTMESDYITKLQEKIKNDLYPPSAATYTVTYDGNGNDGGDVPIDGNSYQEGASISILGNPDGLEKTNYSFIGWNEKADASGGTYSGGETLIMGAANVTLYAQWVLNSYTLTITAGTGGTVTQPSTAEITVSHAEIVMLTADPDTNYTFSHWEKISGNSQFGSMTSESTTVSLTSGNASIKANFVDSAAPDSPTINISPNDRTIHNSDYTFTLTNLETDHQSASYSTDGGSTWETYISSAVITLTEADIYEITAVQVDQSGKTSAMADIITVEIDKTPPAAPTITWTTPAYDSTPTFTWTTPTGATNSFKYRFGTSGDFTPYTSSTYTHSSPLSEGTYYFYVQVEDAAGNWCLTPASKELEIVIPAPSLSLPSGTKRMTNTDFNWSSVTGADEYTIQISLNTDFTPLLVNTQVSNNSYVWTGQRTEGLTYYWHVKTINVDDVSGSWSTTGNFTTKYAAGDTGPAGGHVFVYTHLVDLGGPMPQIYTARWEASLISGQRQYTHSTALTHCSGYSYGGYSDWELPPTIALKAIHSDLKDNNIGSFSSSDYWSAETSGSNAWRYHMGTGAEGWAAQTYGYLVRPVRLISDTIGF